MAASVMLALRTQLKRALPALQAFLFIFILNQISLFWMGVLQDVTLSFRGDPSAPECCIPVRGTPEAVAEASTCLLLSNFLLYCWQVTQSRREQMATSLARGHSLPRWVLEFPSKSGLGAGYAGGTEHPGGAWKKRKPFIATHLVVGWVRGLLLVVTKARGWRHHLCVLCRMQTVSKN